MGFGFYFICIAGGWWFNHRFQGVYPYIQKYAGYEALLASVFTASFLGGLGGVTYVFLGYINPLLRAGIEQFPSGIDAAVSFLGLGWGIVLAEGLNWILDEDKRRGIHVRSLVYFDQQAELLLMEAMNADQLVECTFESRKVYVGYVTNLPSAGVDRRELTIIPLFSGYRDDATLRLVLTTSYVAAWQRASGDEALGERANVLANATVVLPVSELRSVRFFDIEYASAFDDSPFATGRTASRGVAPARIGSRRPRFAR